MNTDKLLKLAEELHASGKHASDELITVQHELVEAGLARLDADGMDFVYQDELTQRLCEALSRSSGYASRIAIENKQEIKAGAH